MDHFLLDIIPDGYINIRKISKDKIEQEFIPVEDISEYVPPQDTDVYFGVCARSAKRGTAAYCSGTRCIWADYDNIQLPEVKQRISENEIPYPTYFINSGHGIHAYWILKETAAPEEVVPIVKGILEKTKGDMRVADPARVMRLPGTINHKGTEPVKCEILEQNNVKYHIDELKRFKANTEPRREYKGTMPEIDNSELPCIRSMAKGVQQGSRNFILGRLTKHLQNKGHTKQKTEEIILSWNTRNDPPESTGKLITDFNAYWHGNYKLLGCRIDNPQLQDLLYDHCDRFACPLKGTFDRLKVDNSVKINNRIFNNIQNMTGNDLIIYGLLLDNKTLNTKGLIKALTPRHTGKRSISDPTMRSCLDRLEKLGLIDKETPSKQTGHSYIYTARKQGNFGRGYTLVSIGAIHGAMDKKITPGEFKLYVMLLKYAYHKGRCNPSTITLSNDLRTTQQYISKTLKALQEAGYIQINREYPRGHERLVLSLKV